jgi:hypothetical protein
MPADPDAIAFNLTREGNVFSVGVAYAPSVGSRLRDAVERTILAIHALPLLYSPRPSLQEFAIYVGRASERTLPQRFRCHRDEKGVTDGMIVCRAPAHRIEAYEDAAIRVIDGLNRRGKLCVKSLKGAPGGSTEAPALIYLVWKTRQTRKPPRRPTPADLAELAREVCDESSYGLSQQQVRDAVRVAAEPGERLVDVVWFDDWEQDLLEEVEAATC